MLCVTGFFCTAEVVVPHALSVLFNPVAAVATQTFAAFRGGIGDFQLFRNICARLAVFSLKRIVNIEAFSGQLFVFFQAAS